jgi:glycosyltransferase involved in cell wall biosynthesis
VYVQPLSRVVHHEGISSGTDLSSGAKAHQVANTTKLFERWKNELQEHQPSGKNVHLAVDRGTIARILVLDHCTPTPDQDAGSITAFNIMRLLRGLGYKVTFIPEDNFTYLPRYTADLQRIGIEVLYLPHVSSVRQHLERDGAHYDAVLVFRVGAAVRHLDLVRQLCPKAKVIFHTSDLHFLREQRRATLAGEESSSRADEFKELELTTMRHVDCVIVHSDVEKEILFGEGIRHVAQFAWAIDVPGTTAGFGDRAHLAFIGGYQHPPNVDAVVYFARQILPLIRARQPGVKFYIVGSLPPPEVRALENDHIIVTGYVPSLGPLLDTIRLSVVPLRYGAGIKGKIGTALSHGLPCVATTIAAEGMALENGVNVAIADGDDAFARAVVDLYNDRARWETLSANGLEFVRHNYSFASGLEVMVQILRTLGLRFQDHESAVRSLPNVPAPVQQRPASASEADAKADGKPAVVQYRDRVKAELEFYNHVDNVHALRKSSTTGRTPTCVRRSKPWVSRGVTELFVDPMIAACRSSAETQTFISIGAGHCDSRSTLLRLWSTPGTRISGSSAWTSTGACSSVAL